MIPNEAIEAAAKALWEPNEHGDEWAGEYETYKDYLRAEATKTLEAAAPYMLATAWDEGREEGYEVGRGLGAPENLNPYRGAK